MPPTVSKRKSQGCGDRIDTPLLRRMNERRLLDAILQHGPLSRTALCRTAGMAAPTITKAADSLLRRGLLEESDGPKHREHRIGRPVRLLQLAARSASVIGIVIDAGCCTVVPAGLDGRHTEHDAIRFATPDRYADLLDELEKICRGIAAGLRGRLHGIGISVPGLVDSRLAQVVFSPNLHLLDRQNPARDLEDRLGVTCRLFQESHSLCLGESMFGAARGLADFAMLDVSTGLGLGVMSGGRLLTGSSGLAGELGHMRIDPRGVRCGCGNRGCLETLATDSALTRLVSEKLGRPLTSDEVMAGIRDGSISADEELKRTIEHLAVAASAVINIFNPSTLFVHGAMLSANDDVYPRFLDHVTRAALTPSLTTCCIVRARGSKRTGALAGIIEHVTSTILPRMGGPS